MKISSRAPAPHAASDTGNSGPSSDQASESSDRGFADHLARFEHKSSALKREAANANGTATGASTQPSSGTAGDMAAGASTASDLLDLLSSAAKTANGLDASKGEKAAAKVDKSEETTSEADLPAGTTPSLAALTQAAAALADAAAATSVSSARGTTQPGVLSSADAKNDVLPLQGLPQTIKQKVDLSHHDADQNDETSTPVGVSQITLTNQIAPAAGAQPGKHDTGESTSGEQGSPISDDASEKQEPVAPTLAGATPSATSDAQPGPLPFTPATSAAKATSATGNAAAAATTPSTSTTLAPGAARTMTLQLAPSELGIVNVRMHVTGSTLDVKLSVAEPQTLGLIMRDHDALAGALRDQQYDLNSLVVQGMATSDSTSSGDQNAQPRSTAHEDMASGDGQSRSGGGSSGQDQPSASGGDRQRRGPTSSDSPYERRTDSLFV